MNCRQAEKGALTRAFDFAESLDIYCTHEVFNDLGQMCVYSFGHPQVGHSTYPPCNYQCSPNLEHKLPTQTTAFDIVTCKPCYHVDNFIHSRNCVLQDVCLLEDDFICNRVRKNQNALQPIEKVRRNQVEFIVFLQELKNSFTSPSSTPVASTDLERDSSKAECKLCDAIQLMGVNILPESSGELTSANTAPCSILFSITRSVGALFTGMYSFNNFSSSWSDERRDSV